MAPVYIIFNKPYGIASQFSPIKGKRTLSDFALPKNVYPAGRLDADSEGLMLLTDDGKLNHKLTSPKYGHPRAYWVQVENIPSEEEIKNLCKGLMLKDGMTKPCSAVPVPAPDIPARVPPVRFRKTVPDCWFKITISEGRNRQVRRMFAKIGHPVLRLFRCEIANICYDNLETGKWKYISKPEIFSSQNEKPTKLYRAQKAAETKISGKRAGCPVRPRSA